MTREEWIDLCAGQYVRRAGMTRAEAAMQASATWDWCVESEGSEEAALLQAPTEYADEDMNCWEAQQ